MTQPEDTGNDPVEETSTEKTPAAAASENTGRGLCGNVTVTAPILEPVKRKDILPIFVVRTTAEELEKFVENHPMDPKGELYIGLKGGEWLNAYEQATHPNRSLQPIDDQFIASVAREGSDWQQDMEFEGRSFAAGKPTIKHDPSAPKLTGSQGIKVIQAKLGLGTLFTFPLYSSGIWITLVPPSDGELLNLDFKLGQEKTALGRQTRGLIFTNQSVFINDEVFNFIMQHVHDCNVDGWNAEVLRRLILTSDLQALFWGMANCIYPNGYTLSQPCTHDTSKCTHTTTEHINLAKISWVDRSALTDTQRRFMSERSKKHTIEQVQAYQTQGLLKEARVITLRDDLKAAIHMPSVGDYLDSGRAWIEQVTAMVTEALANTGDSRAKDRLIERHGRLAVIRFYTHFIKHLESDIVSLTERAEIEKMLDVLSSDTDLIGQMVTDISKYIDDVTINVIALPAWACPSCKHHYTSGEEKHPFLIPLDAGQLFFALRDRRLLLDKISSTS